MCSPVASGVIRLRTDSPNRKPVVVLRVKRKNKGCRSIKPLLSRISRIKLSTAVLKILRLSYCLCCSYGRSMSRECFQLGPSCVKILLPNIGNVIARRGPIPKSCNMLVLGHIDIQLLLWCRTSETTGEDGFHVGGLNSPIRLASEKLLF